MKLVFVHLGPAQAKHLWHNIRRLRRLFPSLEIVLIYDQDSFIEAKDVSSIQIWKYSSSVSTLAVMSQLTHNTSFRQGFWRYSVERLVALRDYQKLFPDHAIIHIESDILVMPNFPFARFTLLDRLAWCSFNETHDVGSIMYLPNLEASTWLVERMLRLLVEDGSLTDMTALRILALSSDRKVLYLNELEGMRNFGGLFDAAPIGMWLTGRDPRNHLGWVRRFLPLPESGQSFESAHFHFNENMLSMGRSDKTSVSIYNLHVHSKRLSLFGRMWRFFLSVDVITSVIRFPSSWFSISAFTAVIRDSYIRHGKLRWKIIIRLLSNHK